MHVLSLMTKFDNDRKEFVNYVEYCVREYGVGSFDSFPEDEQNAIVGFLIKAMDPNVNHEFIIESKDFDVMIRSYALLMIHDSEEHRESFLDRVRKNAREYYAKEIDEFVMEMFLEVTNELKERPEDQH